MHAPAIELDRASLLAMLLYKIIYSVSSLTNKIEKYMFVNFLKTD